MKQRTSLVPGLVVSVAFVLCSGGARAEDDSAPSRRYRAGATYHFDANVEGGFGSPLGRPQRLVGFGRARLGVVAVINPRLVQAPPLYVTAGATVGVSPLGSPTLGLQGEIMHLGSGFWGQAGGFFDVQTPSPGVMASAGFSVLGVELQRRFIDEGRAIDGPRADWVLLGKLRVPVTILLGAL